MMQTVIELTSNLIQTFIWTWFISKFFGSKFTGIIKYTGFIITWLLIFAELSWINYIVIYDGMLDIIMVATLILYAILTLKGNWLIQTFIPIFLMSVVFSLANISIFLGAYVTKVDLSEFILNFSMCRLILLCANRLAEFFICKKILKIHKEYALSNKEWILFTAMPLMFWLILTAMANAVMQSPVILPYMFYCSIIIAAATLLIYYFLLRLNHEAQTQTELELLKMQHDDFIKSAENTKVLYDKVSSLKHDTEKHFLAIHTMAEKGDCESIGKYVNSVLGKCIYSAKKTVLTDNSIFNAIINTRLDICEENNISTNVNIDNEAIQYIKNEDIPVLFGNLLDNAIEAAEHTQDKRIILNIQMQGEYVSISVENTFDENYSDVINLKTTKSMKRRHGYGIKNLCRIVEEYDGMAEFFETKNHMFCSDILLKRQHTSQ